MFSLALLILMQTGPLGPGDHARALTVGRLQRSYLVHVPKSYDGTKPFPVVLIFHGGGSNADAMIRFCGLNETADREGFIHRRLSERHGPAQAGPYLERRQLLRLCDAEQRLARS